MHMITLLFSMLYTQFMQHFHQEHQHLFDFRYLVHFLLFSFPASGFLLACHPHNLCGTSTGNTCVLFSLVTWCISCYFCSQSLTSAATSACQRDLQVNIQHDDLHIISVLYCYVRTNMPTKKSNPWYFLLCCHLQIVIHKLWLSSIDIW